MASLSIIRKHGHVTVVASPVFLLGSIPSEVGTEVAFEMFDANTAHLRTLIGQRHCFSIDDSAETFWAQLKSIEPCAATHSELISKHRPTLRGVLVIAAEPAPPR